MKTIHTTRAILLVVGVLACGVAWGQPGDPGVLGPEEVELWLHPGGSAELYAGPSGREVTVYEALSGNALLNPESPPNPAPFEAYVVHTSTNITAYTTPPFVSLPPGPTALPWTWDASAPASQRDVTFAYSVPTGETLEGDVYYVPEPGTLSLLALGACLPLLRRSRRQGLALIRRRRRG